MTQALIDYIELLEKHDCVIHEECWHDGRRDQLVQEMDKIWPTLSKQEQHDVKYLYTRRIYERRI